MRPSLLSCIGLLTILATGPAMAQRHQLRFEADGDLPSKWLRQVEVAPPQIPSAIAEQLAFLHGKGYLEASVDTCLAEGARNLCKLHVGRTYTWARLSTEGIPKELLSQSRSREYLVSGKPVAPRHIGRLLEELIRDRENNGHPFAAAWLDDLREDAEGISATLRLDPGPLVRIDSIVVKGTARTNLRYLHTTLGIRPGDLYNETQVLALERRIRELPFVTQRQRPYVQFSPERTKVFLFLDQRKASSINGVLGLQPDPITGEIGITGDLDLRLKNALKRGESLALNWRRLADQTQDLRISANLPFVFNTPFGVDGELRIFRRDTTFLEVFARAGVDYRLSRGDKVTAFVQTKSSDRLGSNLVSRPGFADVDILSYGLAVERERFDYRFNPRRGHSLALQGSAGRKRTTTAVLTPGGAEPTARPADVRSVQLELLGTAVGHLPLKQRSTIRVVAQGGWMVNDDLYRNELYRMGGLRTLRGADEASILCSAYAIGTLEYRFVYEENANFFVFVDQAWWEDASRSGYVNDTPLGFGAGTTFETKAGLFSLTYALGRQFENPIQLRGGKVHFGFISLF